MQVSIKMKPETEHKFLGEKIRLEHLMGADIPNSHVLESIINKLPLDDEQLSAVQDYATRRLLKVKSEEK